MYIFRMERSDFWPFLIRGQTNRHLYKITHYKNTASNLLDYIAFNFVLHARQMRVKCV